MTAPLCRSDAGVRGAADALAPRTFKLAVGLPDGLARSSASSWGSVGSRRPGARGAVKTERLSRPAAVRSRSRRLTTFRDVATVIREPEMVTASTSALDDGRLAVKDTFLVNEADSAAVRAPGIGHGLERGESYLSPG